ncbi:MAG: DUF1403 family protein [Silicimonas sp.]|nr:DUF1403 family protein [Silicimonas sp.]
MAEARPLPRWVASARDGSAAALAFRAGAALAHLQLELAQTKVPHALLRDRRALAAAEMATRQRGRPETIGDLRDTLAFLPAGSAPGPAGEIYQAWRRATEKPLSSKTLGRALPDAPAELLALWPGTTSAAPTTVAATLLQAAGGSHPGHETEALLLADAALSRALGESHVLPLLSLTLSRRDMRLTGPDLETACHRAILAAVPHVLREAADLTRRAAGLTRIVPKLRAKGADATTALFLARDALAPSDMTALRSPRAARRFCDRLVDLGVVREMTGRDTFRLYGL